jgi:hypothetical protein
VAASAEAEGPAVSKKEPSQSVVQSKPAPTQAETVKPDSGPAVVASVKPNAALKEAVPNPSVKPTAAFVVTESKTPAAPPSAPTAQANETKPMTKPAAEQPTNPAAATVLVTPAATSSQPVVAPVSPATLPVKAPITIRRAIVPSKEEIDRMKQGQVENRTGQMPDIHTASPLPPKRKETP